MKLLIGLLAAGAMAAGLLGNVFGNHPYTVTAYFLSAEGLTRENDVVINGARVGKVLSVGIAPDNGSTGGGTAGAGGAALGGVGKRETVGSRTTFIANAGGAFPRRTARPRVRPHASDQRANAPA